MADFEQQAEAQEIESMIPLVEAAIYANKVFIFSKVVDGASLSSVVVPLQRVHHFARLRQKLDHVVGFGLDGPDRRLVRVIEVEAQFLVHLLSHFLKHG